MTSIKNFTDSLKKLLLIEDDSETKEFANRVKDIYIAYSTNQISEDEFIELIDDITDLEKIRNLATDIETRTNIVRICTLLRQAIGAAI